MNMLESRQKVTFAAAFVLNSMVESRRGKGSRLRTTSAQHVCDGDKRNKPCPCGSGKKWKRCCLAKRFAISEEIPQAPSLT